MLLTKKSHSVEHFSCARSSCIETLMEFRIFRFELRDALFGVDVASAAFRRDALQPHSAACARLRNADSSSPRFRTSDSSSLNAFASGRTGDDTEFFLQRFEQLRPATVDLLVA